MAKAGADSDSDNQGGFATDAANIIGFSHMHDSGTGGVRSSTHPLACALPRCWFDWRLKNCDSPHH